MKNNNKIGNIVYLAKMPNCGKSSQPFNQNSKKKHNNIENGNEVIEYHSQHIISYGYV